MTKGLIISRKNKEKLFNKKCRVPSFTNIEKFKKTNNMYIKLCRSAKTLYYKNKFEANLNSIKGTWMTIKEALGNTKSTNMPGYFMLDGKNIRTDVEIANGFNEFFSTIGLKLDKKLRSNKPTKEF